MLGESLVSPTTRSPRRVALACIQCRSRKVRCDATLPACNRCVADDKTCEYQKSRRGGRPRRPTGALLQVAVNDTSAGSKSKMAKGSRASTGSNSPGHSSARCSTHSVCDSFDNGACSEPLPLNGVSLSRGQVDQLLAQYYTFFHASHPCVLPRWSLQARMMSEPAISEHLLPVLLYIGSIFTHSIETTPLAEAASQAIRAGRANAQCPNAYHVQALLLYSIAVYWSNEQEKGRELLDGAIESAFSIGMHYKDFAVQNGYGDPLLEESWRRTWWQMHVTDVHISGSTHTYKGLSMSFTATAELPCEERDYESGVSIFGKYVHNQDLVVNLNEPWLIFALEYTDSNDIERLQHARVLRT